MKHLLLAALLFSATASAQEKDTTLVLPNAIKVQPIVYNAITKDTLNQIAISVFGLNLGDTTNGCNTYVQFFDKKRKIGDTNVPIPASVVNKWGTDDKVIEDYILTFLNLKRKP